MPFESAPVRARAKAVLKAFAAYADARGRSWCAMTVLLVETDMPERTVQRGIADLKACGLLEDTGDKEVFKGKLYPIYRLPLERGPQNVRDRLREDRSGVTSVSPQAVADEVCGDTDDTPRGDTGDAARVTPETPKETLNLPKDGEASNPHSSAREAAARLQELEREAPPALLRFYDQPLALARLQQLIETGQDPGQAELLAAMGRMKRHPEFRTRKHPPQLQDWLGKGGFIGWLREDEPALEAEEARTAFASSPAIPAEILAALGDGCLTWLLRAVWHEADRTIVTATWFAAREIVKRVGPQRLADLNLRVEGAPNQQHQPESGN